MIPRSVFFILLVILVSWIKYGDSTFGYYKMYTPYGTGDTIIQTWDGHGGAWYDQPHRKWVVECLDGEALVGILDNGDDYTRMWYLWCKFMFPYKPPSQGIYPYYPSCHVRNYTSNFFCYAPLYHEQTVNTFITGFWGKQWNFILNRAQPADTLNPYKCCKTPAGYYLDYTSCYYQPTHDPFWEYYDSPSYFLVFCATGYVMTGLSRKVNPFTKPDAHIEWIQCCRMGFGLKPIQAPATHGNISYNGETPPYGVNYYNSSGRSYEMPRAYEYPRKSRGGDMAHSRFFADPTQNVEEERQDPYNMLPWNADGSVQESQNISGGNKERIIDPYYASQLKAFFAPTDSPPLQDDAATSQLYIS